MYVLEQQIEREQFPPETEQKYVSFIKEYLAPRYAEFIGKEIQTAYLESLFRVRPEHLRPLRDVRRLLDPGPGVPRHRHRRESSTARAERRTREDREAGGHLQPEGLPQRDRQLRAARARAATRGKNPPWTSYEKLRVVIEKKMFSNTEELLPVISLQRQGQRRRGSASTRTSSTAWCRRATRRSRCACCASGTCACASRPDVAGVPATSPTALIRDDPTRGIAAPRRANGVHQHAAADHRPTAVRQEQVGRQPRALPAPLQGRRSARRCGARSTAAASRDMEKGEDVHIPQATT